MKFKYIFGENKSTGNNAVVIFDIIQTHKDVAQQMTNIIPQSAGFLTFKESNEGITVTCWGESISLKLSTDIYDAHRIKSLMELH